MMVTSYNDGGMTASGYNAQLGVCAVDPRVIPWGTYFTVPGYGTCYAADIGTWIQNDTVDVWLPGSQANGWGVQHRTVTIIANPFSGPTPPPSSSPPESAVQLADVLAELASRRLHHCRLELRDGLHRRPDRQLRRPHLDGQVVDPGRRPRRQLAERLDG